MGSTKTPDEYVDLYGDRREYFVPEYPQHTVTLTKGFWMCRYETTRAQWHAIMGGAAPSGDDANRPAEEVSWNEVQQFLAALNTQGKGVFRLPTEAEWERACRAGTTTEWYFGDNMQQFSNYGWIATTLNDVYTRPVGQKLPNPWNLYDMHGNAIEWCQDWYAEDYYTYSPEVDPQGPAEGLRKVRRSGGVRGPASLCRSAFRTFTNPAFHSTSTGFRIVRDPDGTTGN